MTNEMNDGAFSREEKEKRRAASWNLIYIGCCVCFFLSFLWRTEKEKSRFDYPLAPLCKFDS